MRLRHSAGLAVALFATALAFGPGLARADNGTFNGDYGSDCGPEHALTTSAGDTTIDVAASATVAANDIVLKLLNSAHAVIATGDTLTSPESIHYADENLPAGPYYAQVCEFPNSLQTAPTTYSGTWSTSNAPVTGTPGSKPSNQGITPTPKRRAGSSTFSPATVVDPQRTEGEPLVFIDSHGREWESGPWGTSTQNSFIHRSRDGGLEFHIMSAAGLRPDPPPGGGDTDVVVDQNGTPYFTDLEALANLGTSVSNDSGNTWRKNAAAVQNAAVDRQWLAVDNGPATTRTDNTVFLAFHESAVGTFIYSSPGSTGATDPVGGLVWQNSSAAAPAPLASDATCGQLRFDPVKRNLYYACAEGDHVRLTIGHVAPGQRTGIEYRNVKVPPSPGGGDVGHLFPAVATDAAGQVYVGWIDEDDDNVYYTFSKSQGDTWSAPVRVNSSPAVTNEFLWAQAGAKGHVAFAWLGTNHTGTPDSFPSWKNDPKAATQYRWFGYSAPINYAASAEPVVHQQRFTEKPMHYGQICNQGIGCSASGGDRTMADYFGNQLDRRGRLRFVYNDTTSQHHGAHLYSVRQYKGYSISTGRWLDARTPQTPMADELGDANYPHYGPKAAKDQNVKRMDLTRLAVSQPTRGTLRVKMTLASLASLAPTKTKTRLAWITRFQTYSVGDHGEPAYRIFFVGAESAAGAKPTFFAGTTRCQETDPGNCKVVYYPAGRKVAGRRCGNDLVVDVPFTRFGKPIGHKLFNVTAFSFGRNAGQDVYADFDATHSFDYVRGSRLGGTKTGC